MTLVDLYVFALETAVVIAFPVIAMVAVIGVVVGLLQTLTGVSDQNLSFGPKLAAVALLALLGGSSGLQLVEMLMRQAIGALPLVGR